MDADDDTRALLGRSDDGESAELVPAPPTSCSPCNPSSRVYRYLVLLMICFLSFGSYFCYDIPSSLEDEIKSDMDVSTAQYALLYSLYSWPNVILCFFGGYLIDRVFGLQWGALIFGAFVLVGQVIVTIGAQTDQYWLMLVGRFVFGIGGESLAVAQNAYSVAWFKGKELNMVFGIQLSFSRVGSTINMNVMKPLYDSVHVTPAYKALGITMWIGVLMCVVSMICTAIVAWMDKRAVRAGVRKESSSDEKVNLRDVKDFSLSLWLLFVICVAYYAAVFPFIGLALTFFEEKYRMSASDAHAVNSIVYIVSAAASPVFGFFVDYFGRNVYWVMGATLVTLLCHMLMAFTFLNPWVPMIIFGFAYSVLACALWPMVSLIVPEHQLGTAYGMMQSIQNLGMALISMAAGSIADESGYLFLEMFFCACVSIALMASAALFVVDRSRGGSLNLSQKERSRRDEIEKARQSTPRPSSTPPLSPSQGSALRPRSEYEIRQRFMHKLGIVEPEDYRSHALAYPHVLK